LVSLFALVRAHEVRVGVAGRNRPAEEGDGGRKAAADREALSSLKKKLAVVMRHDLCL